VSAALLRLYPRWWRRRYETELSEVLAAGRRAPGERWDLVRGALDAWLHPPVPSRVASLAAISGGATWTVMGVVEAKDPPTDWPGYAMDVLPLAVVGATLLAVAAASLWLRLGDRTSRVERGALALVVLGHAAWIAGLVAMGLGAGVAAAVGVASAIAAVAAGLVGLALAARGDWPVGAILALAPAALVLTVPAAWLLFGLTWSAVGLVAWPRTSARPVGLA
jgi:hypothetical protein